MKNNGKFREFSGISGKFPKIVFLSASCLLPFRQNIGLGDPACICMGDR